ncbi:MAG: hypothetical protein GY841_06370 [FCB group bacterium]|nr:hypothetical protein [FCB group bacterium]
MRTTEKKRAANRKNAQKSTGPKTEKGKQIVSQNGVKHGLFTRALILNAPALTDDQNEYNSLVYSLVLELQPEGLFEDFLVRKIANCLWRSRRVILAENAQIERQLRNIDGQVDNAIGLQQLVDKSADDPTPEQKERTRSIVIGGNVIPNENMGRNISRYEMRLDRQMTRTLKTLNILQKRRKALEVERAMEDKEKFGDPLKMSNQSQSPYNPIRDNPLHDID